LQQYLKNIFRTILSGFFSFVAMLLSKIFITIVAGYEVAEKLFLKARTAKQEIKSIFFHGDH
jgi:hypothetical protein